MLQTELLAHRVLNSLRKTERTVSQAGESRLDVVERELRKRQKLRYSVDQHTGTCSLISALPTEIFTDICRFYNV